MKKPADWILSVIRCPHCQKDLHFTSDDKSLTCQNNHNFDISKKGYISLLTNSAENKKWDNADMVARRARFHETDNYTEIKDRLAEILADFAKDSLEPLRLLDVGAGPGYYALIAAKLGYQTLACDLSRKALQHAMKLHEDLEGLACDVWSGMPLKDQSFDVIMTIFSPKNPLEFKRVLKPGGMLIVVSPNKDHYARMREVFPLLKVGRQGKTKEDEIKERLEPHLQLESTEYLRAKALLDAQYIEDLIMMGPNAYHTNLGELQEMLASLDEPLEDEGSLILSVYSV